MSNKFREWLNGKPHLTPWQWVAVISSVLLMITLHQLVVQDVLPLPLGWGLVYAIVLCMGAVLLWQGGKSYRRFRRSRNPQILVLPPYLWAEEE